jgi:hypothetical protein
MHELTSSVMNDEERIQCLKPNNLNGEESTCPDLGAMLSQELSPTGGGRSTVGTAHVSGDSTRTNRIAKTCQFRLDSAFYPKGRLRAPHKEFSRAMRRMSSRSSGSNFLRPVPDGRRDRQRQYAFQPLRCQLTTVSGFTMIKLRLHSENH